MIKLCDTLPERPLLTAEAVKIYSAYHCYKKAALFWLADGGTLISMLDGNMVIDFADTDKEELKSFVNMISPKTVFGNFSKLADIFDCQTEQAGVLIRTAPASSELLSDELKSDEIYSLLKGEFSALPDYQSFAVDFCRRKNAGALCYFAKKDKCAAILLKEKDAVLLNGIVSRQKGMGTKALNAVLSAVTYKRAFAIAKKELYPFYIKNGFEYSYETCYWRL